MIMAKDITDVMLGWIFDLFGWIVNNLLKLVWGLIKFILGLLKDVAKALFSKKQQTNLNSGGTRKTDNE